MRRKSFAAVQHDSKYRALSGFCKHLCCAAASSRDVPPGRHRLYTRSVIAFHFDPHILPLPPGHRFPIGKYGLLRGRVEADPRGIELRIAGAGQRGRARAGARRRATSSDVLAGTLSAARQREIGFDWTPALATRAVWSVGATIAAARVALSDGPDGGVAASLGGGTHHANAAQGSGYCVFNDVAVAARLMQAEWHRRRRALLQVAVIDLDVHQGNGTAAIFADDDTVFTFSMHGERNFPFRKSPSDLDVGLPDGCDRRRLPGRAAAGAGRALAPHGRASAGPGLLRGRRRPARGRPPRPPQADDGRPGRARRDRAARAGRARHPRGGADGRRLRPRRRHHGGRAPADAAHRRARAARMGDRVSAA